MGIQNSNKDKDSGDSKEKNDGSVKSGGSEAYLRIMCVKLEMTMARKNICQDNKPIQVTENLFIGSIGAASHRDNMIEFEITHILCCFDKQFFPFSTEFTYKHVPV